MSNNYDNWERLVEVVLRREKDREVALADSRESSLGSISFNFRFGPDSSFHEQNPQLEAYNSNTVNFLGDKMLKIVIRVSMNNDKLRSKALKTVFGVSGVISVTLAGVKKNEVEVLGYRIDAVLLSMALRKKVAHANLVSIAEYEERPKRQPPQAQLFRRPKKKFICFC